MQLFENGTKSSEGKEANKNGSIAFWSQNGQTSKWLIQQLIINEIRKHNIMKNSN